MFQLSNKFETEVNKLVDTIKSQTWSEKEEMRLYSLIRKFGTDWKAIQTFMGCRDRFEFNDRVFLYQKSILRLDIYRYLMEVYFDSSQNASNKVSYSPSRRTVMYNTFSHVTDLSIATAFLLTISDISSSKVTKSSEKPYLFQVSIICSHCGCILFTLKFAANGDNFVILFRIMCPHLFLKVTPIPDTLLFRHSIDCSNIWLQLNSGAKIEALSKNQPLKQIGKKFLVQKTSLLRCGRSLINLP